MTCADGPTRINPLIHFSFFVQFVQHCFDIRLSITFFSFCLFQQATKKLANTRHVSFVYHRHSPAYNLWSISFRSFFFFFFFDFLWTISAALDTDGYQEWYILGYFVCKGIFFRSNELLGLYILLCHDQSISYSNHINSSSLLSRYESKPTRKHSTKPEMHDHYWLTRVRLNSTHKLYSQPPRSPWHHKLRPRHTPIMQEHQMIWPVWYTPRSVSYCLQGSTDSHQ